MGVMEGERGGDDLTIVSAAKNCAYRWSQIPKWYLRP